MKIRHSFVSNSSSSSYIVAYKESIPCEICGRGDIPFIELIERVNDRYETELSYMYEDIKDLGHYKDRIQEISSELKSLSSRDPEEVLSKFTSFEFKVQDKIKSLTSEHKYLIDLLSKVKKYIEGGYKVAEFSISYHDLEMGDELNARINSGEIIVIEGPEEE